METPSLLEPSPSISAALRDIVASCPHPAFVVSLPGGVILASNQAAQRALGPCTFEGTPAAALRSGAERTDFERRCRDLLACCGARTRTPWPPLAEVLLDSAGKPVRAQTWGMIASSESGPVALLFSQINPPASAHQVLSTVARALRTPVQALAGHLDHLALRWPAHGERGETLLAARRHAGALLGLARDLADLARLEAGSPASDETPFLLARVLGEVFSLARATASERGLRLNVRFASELPRRVTGDAQRLRQVVSTVIDQVMEEASRGVVTVRIASVGPLPHRLLAFEVSAGSVAPTTDLPLDDPWSSRTQASSAIRLAVAARLAELLGGSLEDRSFDDTLVLCATIAPDPGDFDDLIAMEPELQVPSDPWLSQAGSVHVVADESRGPLLGSWLSDRGFLVHLRERGREVDSAACAVLVDDVSDQAVAEVSWWRACGYAGPLLVMAEDERGRRELTQAGCSAVIRRPVSPDELVSSLRLWMDPPQDRPIRAPDSSSPLRSWREADPVVRELLPKFISHLGWYASELEHALAGRDEARARSIVEALRASATSYGLAQLVEAADRLETSLPGAMGDDGTRLRGALAALGDLVDQLRTTYPFRASAAAGSR